MHNYKYGKSLHHGIQPRAKKDRDGQNMPANGGAATSESQCAGYSYSQGEMGPRPGMKEIAGHSKAQSKSKGQHVAYKK